MADTKFSALTAVSSVAGSNEFGLNEGGVSKKCSATQLKAFTSPDTSTTTPGLIQLADQAGMEAAVDPLAVTPQIQHFHPSAAKFWVYWTANSTTILASYNMTSIADTAVGDADGTIATDFSSANWAGFVGTNDASTNGWDADSIQSSGFNARAAGTFGVLCGFIIDGGTAVATLVDPQQWQAVGFGDL